ncbi:MAG: iron-containing alcohol dehydrogenase [Betaproteobacteria bacterium]|jgi:4-hydroxybutyrate dehydrogenase
MNTINYLTRILIDFGALKALRAECAQLGMVRPLIVTDAGIRALGLLAKLMHEISELEMVVFDQTPSNPNEASVLAAKSLYVKHQCDGIIALGGGSSMDCAKGVAIMVSHPGELKTYATIEGGSTKITDRVPAIIAIPTTAGTGSEVARGAILIVADGRKLGFHSWHLMPKLALLDPELTLSLPPLLTAATGMDAIAHCMETFMSSAFNPPADGIALDGLERGWRYIEKASLNGDNREARLHMMSASMQGAMAFQKGLGCVHSLSHSLGGINPKLHHGTLNALFLPSVVQFNQKDPTLQSQNKMQRMAYAMGLGHPSNAGQEIAQAIKELSDRLGLPKGLKDYGVQTQQFDDIVFGALKDHCHLTNPVLASAEDYKDILLHSM